jgi:hypothetical protein
MIKCHKNFFKLSCRFFCNKDYLYRKFEKDNIGLKKLTLQILKYLENNQDIYSRLCKESEQLAFEISSNSSELLRNELMRVNKQIHEFSKENYYWDEFSGMIEELLSANTMYNESIEINEKEIAASLKADMDNIKGKINAFQDEIIEFLIPNNEV